jgi:2-succinyl-6-hydroxy-2,4-cyclohexadiene-1-carboxylate synthase
MSLQGDSDRRRPGTGRDASELDPLYGELVDESCSEGLRYIHRIYLYMPVLDGADVHLNYVVIGEGVPVTLLHGFTLSGRSWQEVISKLPTRFKWVVPDLRGHGATRIPSGAPCTMDACTRDLEMLWDHLGIERTHLVGYSMGGRLALHVAARRPERVLSLLTIGAHAGLDEEAREGRRQGDEALAQRIETEGLEAFVDYWSALPLLAGVERRGPAFTAQLRAERMTNHVHGLAKSLRGMGAGAMEPVWEQLAQLTCPCTFVAGQLDHGYVASARRLASTVVNGRLEVVVRAGHAVHLERPEAFANVLTAHLARAEPKSEASPSSSTWD